MTVDPIRFPKPSREKVDPAMADARDRAAERAKFRNELIADWLEVTKGANQAEAEEHADAMLAAFDRHLADPRAQALLAAYPIRQASIDVDEDGNGTEEHTWSPVPSLREMIDRYPDGSTEPAPLDTGRWEREEEPEADCAIWRLDSGDLTLESPTLSGRDGGWTISAEYSFDEVHVTADDFEAAARIIRYHQEGGR